MNTLIKPLKEAIADYDAGGIHDRATADRLRDHLRVLFAPQNFSREEYALACADARAAIRETRGNDSI